MKIHRLKILKFVDAFLGRILVYAFPPTRQKELCEQPRHILILRPGGIGDSVLLIPAIQRLKGAFPEARITVLAENRNGAIFSLSSEVDRVLRYDRPRELLTAMSGLYDVVIDTEQWHRLSAVIARLVGAPMSMGFATNERKRLFTNPVSYSHDDHETVSFLHLLMPLGISNSFGIKPPYLTVPSCALHRANELLGNLSDIPFVILFPGASIPERRWGVKNFRELVRKFHGIGVPSVVIGGREDVSDGDAIVERKLGLNLAGKTSLVETAAIIKKALLLVSGDSGILHVGAGLGKPTVSLFGPGIAKKWAPQGNNHIVINKNFPCSPCTRFGYTPKCSVNARCMSEITIGEVFESVEKLIRMGRA